MDYGSSTKRYGDYILDDKNVKNEFEAENKVKELFMSGSDPDLNPYFNFTRGKIPVSYTHLTLPTSVPV